MDMTLVVMAAGLGSRYGGVKQIERLGPDGEILMEYAIYDALRAGFDRIVLIIKPQMLQDVRDLFGDRIEQRTGMRIDYAFQTPDRFTAARPELAQRSKPLGTVHAVLCARDVIRTPFAVINADDFYGRGAIDAIAAALPELHGAQDAAMVGYRLKNTVSPFGTVTRGVCATENGLLRKVQETYKIQLGADGTIRDTSDAGAGVVLDPEAIVSMNLWGYHPAMLDVMAQYFDAFGNGEPDEQLQGVFRFFHLGKAAAGAHDANHKEQHQKRKANGPHRVVDVDNDAPDGAALKLFRALGDELPNLGQVLVPGVEGILQILNNPVIGHSTTSFPATVRGRPPWTCPRTAVIRISR